MGSQLSGGVYALLIMPGQTIIQTSKLTNVATSTAEYCWRKWWKCHETGISMSRYCNYSFANKTSVSPLYTCSITNSGVDASSHRNQIFSSWGKAATFGIRMENRLLETIFDHTLSVDKGKQLEIFPNEYTFCVHTFGRQLSVWKDWTLFGFTATGIS